MVKQLTITRDSFVYLCREMAKNWQLDLIGMIAMGLTPVKLGSSLMKDDIDEMLFNRI